MARSSHHSVDLYFACEVETDGGRPLVIYKTLMVIIKRMIYLEEWEDEASDDEDDGNNASLQERIYVVGGNLQFKRVCAQWVVIYKYAVN